jgi:DNA-binding ferritin-like protein
MDCALPELDEDLEKCQDTYHDAGTSDSLRQHMASHAKMAWMLLAFLKGKSV